MKRTQCQGQHLSINNEKISDAGEECSDPIHCRWAIIWAAVVYMGRRYVRFVLSLSTVNTVNTHRVLIYARPRITAISS